MKGWLWLRDESVARLITSGYRSLSMGVLSAGASWAIRSPLKSGPFAREFANVGQAVECQALSFEAARTSVGASEADIKRYRRSTGDAVLRVATFDEW